MNIKYLNVGILHSLIGKNDGVSIVIDQTVQSMVKDMGMRLGNIYFLAAHTSPRFNAQTDEVFWHKNKTHKNIIKYFSQKPPEWLDHEIHSNALHAKEAIVKFIEQNEIDLLIAHNTSHPYNFVTAVGLGYYMEELRQNGLIWPKIIAWWHDSFFEREQFKNPNPVIQKYLKYLPGTLIDGCVFINSYQTQLGRRYFEQYGNGFTDEFFQDRVVVIPNTSDVPWDWQRQEWETHNYVHPDLDSYNKTFLHDLGIREDLQERGFTLENTAFLLQHTRIVPRKKIEIAIDLAFRLEQKFRDMGEKKCVVLLVSGHSGDEQTQYKEFLYCHYGKRLSENPDANVLFYFGEERILSHRDIIVDTKYYNFAEVPGIMANYNAVGTYFSEVEGYGNNLLEMISYGLPVLINRYDIYSKDIEKLGFDLPYIENLELTDRIVDEAYNLFTDHQKRNRMVRHNLKILQDKLDHRIIAKQLTPLLERIYTRLSPASLYVKKAV